MEQDNVSVMLAFILRILMYIVGTLVIQYIFKVSYFESFIAMLLFGVTGSLVNIDVGIQKLYDKK